MPTQNLTDRFLAGKRDAGNYFDTHTRGLCVRVTPAGARLWSFVYRVKGRGPQWMSLGSYPTLKLADARLKARPLRQAVDDGRDPIAERKAADALALVPPPAVAPVMTVRKFAPAFITFQKGKKKTWQDDDNKLDKYILPAWGDLPVSAINRQMIAELLTAIAADGLTTGVNRYQAVISRFLTVAINDGIIDGPNPASRMIKRFDETPRTRVLSEPEIRTLYAQLDTRPSEAADVFWLRLLLGQRAEETAGMLWAELDQDRWGPRTWFMDGDRTKNGVEHLLWLPDLAVQVLERRRAAVPKKDPRVFPALAGSKAPKHHRAISTEVGALFKNFDWRDLRRTFSTGLGDLGFDDGVIDRLLNHKAATVGRKHYNHAKYLPEKQMALAAWDRELTRILRNEPKTARVVSMIAR